MAIEADLKAMNESVLGMFAQVMGATYAGISLWNTENPDHWHGPRADWRAAYLEKTHGVPVMVFVQTYLMPDGSPVYVPWPEDVFARFREDGGGIVFWLYSDADSVAPAALLAPATKANMARLVAQLEVLRAAAS